MTVERLKTSKPPLLCTKKALMSSSDNRAKKWAIQDLNL